jgi:hypothetical protein
MPHGNYEPPLSRENSPLIPGQEELIAPGVRGYAILGETGKINIPLVIAEREGSGDVGRFIDSLSSRCVFPCVISLRLALMLFRRGFAPRFDGEVDIWERA